MMLCAVDRDRILWVETFLDTQNRLPTVQEAAEELEISTSKAKVVLGDYESYEYLRLSFFSGIHDLKWHVRLYCTLFADRKRMQKKDLMELLMDLNVRDDAVIWWNEIVNALKTYPSKSLWV